MTFKLVTLVDITPTGVIRNSIEDPVMQLKRNQQRNFETTLQVLGLRTQPHISKYPCSVKFNAPAITQLFGETFHGKDHNVWTFYFTADHPLSYNTNNGELCGLLSDFEQVPVITGLTETAHFMLPIFYPYGSIKNIHISKIAN